MREINWSVKHTVDFNKEYDLLETLLLSSGVLDVDKFMKVNSADTYDGMLMDNMKQGIELLHQVLTLDKEPSIFVKVDSDVDGFTSSAYIIQFIKEITQNKVKIDCKISLDKSHGINAQEDLGNATYDLVIVPDAGSEDVDDCYLISTSGMPVLILDHHQFSNPEIHKYATVINCTDGHYPNPTLSGVGVVHKFCIEYCKEYNLSLDIPNKYLDLVAFGMIADSMDMRNLETRYYALEGLKDKYHNNEFLNELYARFPDDLPFGRTIHNTGWVVAPRLNAIVRYGTPEEQMDTLRALIGEQEDREYQPRRPNGSDKKSPKPPIEIHSLQKTMARVCDNAKARQDNAVRTIFNKCVDEIKSKHLDDNSVIVLDATSLLDKHTVTGLIANKIASTYKRPTLLLVEYNKDTFGGSGRGYGKGSVSDFRGMLSDTGLFEKCAGHNNAFGILLDKEKVSKVIEKCNEQIEISDLVQVYEVDYEIQADKLKEENLYSVANAYSLWGNGVEEPTFAITDICIPASYINGYSREGSSYIGYISFVYNHIPFFKKYCAKSDFEDMTLKDRHTLGKNKKNLKIDLIGKFVLTEVNGIKKPEIMILDFQSREDTEKKFDYKDDFEEEMITKQTKRNIEVEDDFVF